MTQKHDQIAIAEKLFSQAFDKPRDPRSCEYKAGVRAALRFRLAGEKIPHLYKPGTAQDDAYHAGISEGYMIFRNFEGDAKNG